VKQKTLVVGLLLVVFILSVGSANAYIWKTGRNDVTITSGYVDISDTLTLSDYTVPSASVSGVVKLPTSIENLTFMRFNVSNAGASNLSFNLTVNTKALNASTWVIDGTQGNITKANYVTASGDVSLENITWAFEASDQCNLTLYLVGEDMTLNTYWLTQNLVMKERDISTPTVSNSRSSVTSSWTVNNSINITNTWGINLTDLVVNVTYPSNRVTNGTGTFTVSMDNDTTLERYTQYQKRGPYVYRVQITTDGTSYEIEITLRSPETIRSIVDWTLDTSEDVYDDYFDTLNYNNLIVELNDHEEDWGTGSIVLDDFTVMTSPSGNVWTFSWVIPSTPVTAPGWHEQVSYGLPNWIWLLFVTAVVLAAIYIFYIEKPAKKSGKKK